VTLALPYLYLALAIVFEVVGTSALKASETFTRLVPSLVTLIAYTVSFPRAQPTDDPHWHRLCHVDGPWHRPDCHDRMALVQAAA
jgi:Small Multidrug Resistance protein